MKVLFWILVILSIPVGLFMSFFSWLSHGLDLSGTIIGEVMCIPGMLSLLVCIICMILGIKKLCKGNVKKAIVCAVVALGYCAAIFAGIALDDAVHTMQHNKRISEREKQMYGENWNDAPAIDGIPKLYQKVLNTYYAVVRDRWSGEQLMDLGAVAMADYYGDVSLDNIGFALMDLNNDNVDELLIGAVAKPEQQANEIFCIYFDPENPHYYINSVEGDVYYLHFSESQGAYMAEIAGSDMVWLIKPAETENYVDFDLKEEAIDPAGRMTLALIPFSQYK